METAGWKGWHLPLPLQILAELTDSKAVPLKDFSQVFLVRQLCFWRFSVNLFNNFLLWFIFELATEKKNLFWKTKRSLFSFSTAQTEKKSWKNQQITVEYLTEKRQKHKVFVFLLNSAPPIFQTLHRLCIYKKGRKNDKKHISKDYLLNCRCSNRIQNFCCKNLGEVILNRFSNFATFLLTVKNPHKIGLQNMDSVAKLLRN